MHRVGQDNNVSLGERINPQRSAGKSGMAIRPHRQQLAAVAGEGRVNIPSQAAENGGIGRLLRRGHLLDDLWREDLVAIEQRLGKAAEVIGGGKQPGMSGDATHAARPGIVDHPMQHDTVLVILCRSDLRQPGVRRQKSGVGHVQQPKEVGFSVLRQRHARDPLHDGPKDNIVGIAVAELRAGR